jgi:hypothetical protein
MITLRDLYLSLNERRRPEDVSDLILTLLNDQLSDDERKVIQKAANLSLRHQFAQYTSMLQTFAQPVGLNRQVHTAANLFKTAYTISEDDSSDPEKVEQFLRTISPEINKTFGSNDFKKDRLNREARRAAGMDLSRRRYNKLFRHLTRMEDKLHTLIREIKKLCFTKIGKSGLASQLDWETFSADLNSACFVAYLTARSNLRSEFTIYGQQRAYDEIADMLFERCKRSSDANWWAIAHVYPHNHVMQKIGDEQKGELLGRWFTILREIAALLKEIWSESDFERDTMIVQRGNDSTTWNNTASAWNKARDNWMSLIYAMGMEGILDAVCPGKVMRLMAGDVANWHVVAGGGLDPNTFVWREVPLPWEVLEGTHTCTATMIRAVCEKHHLDPEKSAWIAPRPRTAVATFHPTPELVHGVSVSDAQLATFLKKTGFFSGKAVKGVASLPYDELWWETMVDHDQRLTRQQNKLE